MYSKFSLNCHLKTWIIFALHYVLKLNYLSIQLYCIFNLLGAYGVVMKCRHKVNLVKLTWREKFIEKVVNYDMFWSQLHCCLF